MHTLSFKDIWSVAKKNIIWITAFPIVLLATVFILYSYFIPKQYTSNVQLFVTVNADGVASQTYESLLMTQGLTDTYAKLIQSPKVLKNVVKETKAVESFEEIQRKTAVNVDEKSLVYSISYKSENPEESALVVNAIAKYASKELKALVKGTKVTIITSGEYGTAISNVSKYIITFIIGIILSISFLIIAILLDTIVTKEEQLTDMGVVVLGDVPHVRKRRSRD
ncbi:hypothetical protein BMT55_03780 [Listeria newyorkensis]|uniref:Polysaccharide chain length determinant N-terminal domain-containing protein n=1 Tax=Listeria newyorkensis TaxID=1497681 RepID=A0ABX4XPX3_9LIST|nr:Wzz/FepE/Etk N-terminal domain-containing protein [Listeria newyorkensis]KGL41988.1 hypothetical protein EP58_10645 [Listeria newyorkensis]PNP93896.1 hypothetical protein BMT55_03780 [Listeria newyorkensis]WAO22522.1 Wzz/FepE/Etk N-terminal domain-containing protein [Listeria newyorkensis]SQC51120.1 Capsular polysaccharide type 8 biosynthesis protein cap8A [Listeria newyorkensis]